MLTQIGTILGTILKPAGDIIDNLHTSKEEKLALKLEMTKVTNSLTEKYLELEAKTIEAKGQIMVEELKQSDNYTKRARPTIVYSGLVFLLINHIICPWTAWFGMKIWSTVVELPTIDMPAEFWIAWGGVCGVYAFSRGKEKIKGLK